MREKRGLFIYLAGSAMMAVSVFLPYLRYKFVMEGLIEYKESYNLIHVKEIEAWFIGIDAVSLFAKVIIYLVVVAGIWGVVMAFFQMLSRTSHISLKTLALTGIVPLIGIVANIVIQRDGKIREVSDIIHGYKSDLLSQGFSGSSGYGVGFFLLLAGTILTVLGLTIYFMDSNVS